MFTPNPLTPRKNLEEVLKGAGMSLKNVVKANIYLSNLSRDFAAVNEVSGVGAEWRVADSRGGPCFTPMRCVRPVHEWVAVCGELGSEPWRLGRSSRV
jgi:enamine deaminase RidA (YjgF/YER057c/UK114 family)